MTSESRSALDAPSDAVAGDSEAGPAAGTGPAAASAVDRPLGVLSWAALVMAVVACRLLAIHSFPIYDDAFITYRFAENLAAGHGMVFNTHPDAIWEPVLGTTTPGYAVLLALSSWTGLTVTHASWTINFLCDALSAVLVVRLFGARRLAATVAVLGFAAVPNVARISVGGMEAPLFLALALGAFSAARSGRLGWAGLLAALDCTVRPEGVLLVAVIALFHVRSWRQARDLALPVLVIGLAVTAILFQVYGHPIPQSVRAKAGDSGEWFERCKDTLAQAFGPSIHLRLLFPFVALGFFSLLRHSAGVRPFVFFALAVVGAYAAAGVKTWGWYFYVPLVAWMSGLGLGVEWLVERSGAWRERLTLLIASRSAVLGFSLFGVLAVIGWTRVHPDEITPNVYGRLRAWAETRGLEERGASIVASDIGAIGYFSRALILDSEGLVWPGANRFRGEFRESQQVAIVAEYQPDYVMLVVTKWRLRAFAEHEVSKLYRPLVRFNSTGEDDLEPDHRDFGAWWEQDYLIYEKQAP